MNLKLIEARESPEKFKKYKQNNSSHLSKSKEKLEVDYNYYICDFCGKEIRIEKDWEKRTGGTYKVPMSIWPRGSLKIAVHNSCLEATIQEIEEKKRVL